MGKTNLSLTDIFRVKATLECRLEIVELLILILSRKIYLILIILKLLDLCPELLVLLKEFLIVSLISLLKLD